MLARFLERQFQLLALTLSFYSALLTPGSIPAIRVAHRRVPHRPDRISPADPTDEVPAIAVSPFETCQALLVQAKSRLELFKKWFGHTRFELLN